MNKFGGGVSESIEDWVKRTKCFERLMIYKEYDDFPTFYKNSKDVIYRKIIETYEKTKIPGQEMMTLIVSGTIDDHYFDTDFPIKKTDLSLLTDVVNPYFESIEDYETCGKIMELCKELKG